MVILGRRRKISQETAVAPFSNLKEINSLKWNKKRSNTGV
jgi:hypothetical protein